MPATTPYRKKSFRSMVAPMSAEVTTLRMTLGSVAVVMLSPGCLSHCRDAGTGSHATLSCPVSPCLSSRTMSAAFSAIITTGALVLPETRVGMTEQYQRARGDDGHPGLRQH